MYCKVPGYRFIFVLKNRAKSPVFCYNESMNIPPTSNARRPYWKTFLPFLIFLTFFKFGGGLHYTMMAPFGEKVFPLWLVGLVIGIVGFIQMALDMPAGYLLDKFGYKKLLKLTTGLFFLASLFFLFGPTPASFVMTLLVGAFGWLFFGPGTSAYTLIQSPRAMIGRFVAVHDVFASLGIVLSSTLLIFIIRFDTPIIGAILCAIFLIAFIGISLSPEEKAHPIKQELKRHHYFSKAFFSQAFRSVAALKPISFMLLTTSLISSIFYAIIWFVVPLLLAHTQENGVLGLGLAVFDFAVVALGFFLGRLVDGVEKKLLVICGLIVFGIAGTLLGFNFGVWFILLGFIATAGDELTGLALWAWLYHIDKEKKHYGLISSAISFFEDIGWAIGPVIAGILYSLIGATYTIAAGGFLIFLNLFFFYLFVHPFSGKAPAHPLPPHRLTRRKHKH